jgi:hypothetical protein
MSETLCKRTARLLSIQHLDPIYANFTITERDLPEVQKEMARGTLKAMVRLPSDAEGGDSIPSALTIL